MPRASTVSTRKVHILMLLLRDTTEQYRALASFLPLDLVAMVQGNHFPELGSKPFEALPLYLRSG